MTQPIDELAKDVKAQLLERINTSLWYTLQVEESTDVDNKVILLVCVHYLYQGDVHEDALSLPNKTTAIELSKLDAAGWLHMRKTEMVLLCRVMHRRSCCRDRTAVWFDCSD